jgi:protein N-terminal methyltransferase
MLGGLGFLADLDVAASLKFLESLPGLSVTERKGKALDCGAGIGRVSENLLLKLFEKVDLVEPNPDFIKKAKETLPTGSVDRCYEMGLQDYVPESGAVYDCLWIQWVIIYLTDCDFVKFLESAASALASPTSFICIKDNVMRPGLGFSLDRDDSSVTRSEAMLKDIFQKAGLKIVKREEQSDFPRELFPVIMYALQKI